LLGRVAPAGGTWATFVPSDLVVLSHRASAPTGSEATAQLVAALAGGVSDSVWRMSTRVTPTTNDLTAASTWLSDGAGGLFGLTFEVRPAPFCRLYVGNQAAYEVQADFLCDVGTSHLCELEYDGAGGVVGLVDGVQVLAGAATPATSPMRDLVVDCSPDTSLFPAVDSVGFSAG
jgi:hypothetical protein